LLLLLMRKFSACTVDWAQNWVPLNKSRESWDQLTFLTQASCATCFGQIPTKMFKDGVKTIVEYLSLLARKLCQLSLRNTTSI
jgi:hypothetical protein